MSLHWFSLAHSPVSPQVSSSTLASRSPVSTSSLRVLDSTPALQLTGSALAPCSLAFALVSHRPPSAAGFHSSGLASSLHPWAPCPLGSTWVSSSSSSVSVTRPMVLSRPSTPWLPFFLLSSTPPWALVLAVL
ncbi:hypothetical protein ROHU_037106 [Labeo rohita]|uniref:Uncharacterized protein n=1 Tax=Labeo rohita TaxID=84645 RepID=A0A498M4A6_LABRO|nr:hypothetical protein ROHU_037106 [Labeo rohita]